MHRTRQRVLALAALAALGALAALTVLTVTGLATAASAAEPAATPGPPLALRISHNANGDLCYAVGDSSTSCLPIPYP